VAFKPVTFTLGYLGNSEDGYAVSFDDSAKIITTGTMGQIWWQNAQTGVSIGAPKTYLASSITGTAVAQGAEDELKVIYATLGWDVTDSIKLALTYVDGEAELTATDKVTKKKREFTEITPAVSYKHSKNLTLSAFYAMLETERSGNGYTTAADRADQNRDRFRFEALYKF
jgi:predicted porin